MYTCNHFTDGVHFTLSETMVYGFAWLYSENPVSHPQSRARRRIASWEVAARNQAERTKQLQLPDYWRGNLAHRGSSSFSSVWWVGDSVVTQSEAHSGRHRLVERRLEPIAVQLSHWEWALGNVFLSPSGNGSKGTKSRRASAIRGVLWWLVALVWILWWCLLRQKAGYD